MKKDILLRQYESGAGSKCETEVCTRERGAGRDKGDHDGFSEISFILLRGDEMRHETIVI